MQKRERILFFSAIGAVAVGVAYILFFNVLITPAAENQKEAYAVEVEIVKHEAAIDAGKTYAARLHEWAAATFGPDEAQAIENARAHLVNMLNTAQLGGAKATMQPASGGSVSKVGDKEVGWFVKTSGSVAQVTHLLYLLQNDPYLHRVENLSWMPISKTTDVQFSFRYVTVVLGPAGVGDEKEARQYFVGLIEKHGLSHPQKLVIQPVTEEKPAATGRMRWDVGVEGPEARLETFMARLQRDPYLRLAADPVEADAAAPNEGRIEFQVAAHATRYNAVELAAKPADQARGQYALISERDLFRPYIKKPPPPPQPQEVAAAPVNRPAQLKVVGLPTWKGKPTVVVRDAAAGATQTYAVGDKLIGGEIVMVDYRPLPDPRKPQLLSSSRVIVRLGREHWAIEIGGTLADKRKLQGTQLPEELNDTAQEIVTQEAPDAP